jgi:hypothetical protein
MSTTSTNGFRTFSVVFALASQNLAPWAAASASPSSTETARLESALSSFVPTYRHPVSLACSGSGTSADGSTTYQVERHVRDGVVLDFLEPPVHAQEAGSAGDVVDQQDAVGAAVEAC